MTESDNTKYVHRATIVTFSLAACSWILAIMFLWKGCGK